MAIPSGAITDIFPATTCQQATKWFDELPSKEELGEEHAPTLMAVESHRLQPVHDADCFVNRPKN